MLQLLLKRREAFEFNLSYAHIHNYVPLLICLRVADKAWLMLKTYLETYDTSFNYKLQKCVARKLLSLGSSLPQWMVKRYKVCTYVVYIAVIYST